MVSPLYDFLNAHSDAQSVQKTLGKEYNSRVFRQYEFLCVAAKYLDF